VNVYKITVLTFSMVVSMYAMKFSLNHHPFNSPPFNTDYSNDQLADKITTLAGQALVDLPEINVASEKGELSYSEVRVMTRVAIAASIKGNVNHPLGDGLV
jgi:hypothetical protein